VGDRPTLLDIEAVAECLAITERHVRRLVAERRIPFVKVGRFVRFDPVDIVEWIDAARVPERELSQRPSSLQSDRTTPTRASRSVSRL
jgi:excisionase family DNA binding protein